MLTTLKTTVLAGVVGLAALASVPAAQAGGHVIIGIGGHHGPQAGIILDDPFFPRRHGHIGPERGFVKPVGCSVDKALWKAQERYGLHRVEVAFVNKHVIGIEGRKKGKWREIVFSRAPGCPVVDY